MVDGLVEVGVGLVALSATLGVGYLALRLLLRGIAHKLKPTI